MFALMLAKLRANCLTRLLLKDNIIDSYLPFLRRSQGRGRGGVLITGEEQIVRSVIH